MKAFLASSLGGSFKVQGKRVPQPLLKKNHLCEALQKIWPEQAKVLFVCGTPDEYFRNDELHACIEEAFSMSGLQHTVFQICDGRMQGEVCLKEYDVVILAGGHVPTQNRFFAKIHLKEKLQNYDGLLVAWSAGAMNCAETVYAAPEADGEAVDPDYQRWIPGLGITGINMFPHFGAFEGAYLDGLRVIEDILYADSMGHDIYAMENGSYILVEDGKETIYGETWLIQDGQIRQICRDGEEFSLNTP